MAPEETTPTEAEVKPAAPARKQRAPRKKAAATQATGDAGAPAASAEAAAPAKKQRTPRKKTTKPAAEVPAPAGKPAGEPAAPAPAPVEKPAEAPAAPVAEQPKPQEQQPRKERNNGSRKDRKPEKQQQPAPVAEKTAQPERPSDIENPDAAPQLPPAPGFAAPETVGGNEGGSNSRRKRRRNRNRNRENGQQPQQPQASPQVDKEELVRRAWKIYLGEVTEDGLALMDDRTAAEAARRSFRVAEIFLIEAARHRPAAPTAVEEPTEDPEVEDAADEMEQE